MINISSVLWDPIVSNNIMAIEFWAALPKKLLPPVIIAGVLGHSLAILMTTYAHYIPGTQDEAARLMDNILTPIPIDLISHKR
jgi:hypothetical protein